MTDVLNDGHSKLQLVDVMGSDQSVVNAARVSYAGDGGEWRGEKDEKLINYMAKHNHGTPFEHTSATFLVECPLFVRGQWHRHRIGWSYNEISRRYTADDIKFHIPEEWRAQNKSGNKQGSQAGIDADVQAALFYMYNNLVDMAEDIFREFIHLGVANEQARMMLPQSMYTRFYATCNLRSATHFMQLRDDPHAQPEIRAYAKEMREQLREVFPVSIAALMGEHHEPSKVNWWQQLLQRVGYYA